MNHGSRGRSSSSSSSNNNIRSSYHRLAGRPPCVPLSRWYAVFGVRRVLQTSIEQLAVFPPRSMKAPPPLSDEQPGTQRPRDTPYFVIRPHRSITYVHAACCYRPSCVVCLSVCPSVTLVSPAKRLNRSRCRLGNGLGWAQLSMY